MDRVVSYRYCEAIQIARSMIPDAILARIGWVHFLTGTDPIFAGLHQFEQASYGRSLRNTSHVAFEHNQPSLPASLRYDTVVLTIPEHPLVIVHELGHVLHARLSFEWDAEAVEDYGRTDSLEAFAMMFGYWLQDRENVRHPRIADRDRVFMETLVH